MSRVPFNRPEPIKGSTQEVDVASLTLEGMRDFELLLSGIYFGDGLAYVTLYLLR